MGLQCHGWQAPGERLAALTSHTAHHQRAGAHVSRPRFSVYWSAFVSVEAGSRSRSEANADNCTVAACVSFTVPADVRGVLVTTQWSTMATWKAPDGALLIMRQLSLLPGQPCPDH